MELLDVNSCLPSNIGTEALDVAVLQDALLRLEQFQYQARTALFQKLSYHAQHSTGGVFEEALFELAQHAQYLAADTPEATVAQYAQHYQRLVEQEQQLLAARAAQQSDQDFQAQLLEFRTLLQQGQLSEAAWCLARLHKTVHAQELQHQQAVRREAASMGGAGQSEGGSPTAHVGGAHTAVLEAQLAAAQQHVQHCQACEQELSEALTQGISSSVYLEQPTDHAAAAQGGCLHVCGSVLLPLPAHPDGLHVPSKEVWAALQAQGTLQQHAEQLTDLILQQVLRPLLSTPSSWHANKQPCSSAGAVAGSHDTELVLTWQLLPTDGQSQAGRCCEAVRQVLQALGSTMLQLDEGLMKELLGDVLWGPLCQLYVDAYVQPAAAAAASTSGPARSAALHALVKEATDLEDWAANMGFIEGSSLKPAVCAAIAQLEAQQQVTPLDAARAALLKDLQGQSDTCVVGGLLPVDTVLYQRLLAGQAPEWEAADPGCGLLTRCPLLVLSSAATAADGTQHASCRGVYRVGQGVVEVAQLAERLLADAAAAGSQTAATALVHCLRKVGLLARCLPQAQNSTRSKLANVLPLALLHHNGLCHLADTLLTCCPMYGPVLEPVLGEPLGLVEPALLLRQEAQQLLQQQVSSQLAALQELLQDGYQGFKRLGRSASAQEGIAHRKTTAQVLHSLGRLGRVLADHLTPEEHAQVAVQVLGGVCTTASQYILAKSDLGIDDCKELKEVLQPLAQQSLAALIPAASLNTPHPASSTDQAGNTPSLGLPAEVLRSSVHQACAPLRCLGLLLGLLDAGLKDIVSAWEQGKLQACGLTADHVVHLILALFEASEYRRDAIARIRASSW